LAVFNLVKKVQYGFSEFTEISKAAFVNGTACGSLDWDDSHVAAIIHPGVCIWPAAISVAYQENSSGEELLTAVVAGYETAIRIGMSIQPEHSLRGFQGTPTCGALGAAVACAKLMKLSEEQIQNALGIAATFACGISQIFCFWIGYRNAFTPEKLLLMALKQPNLLELV
jgi:2-methylcitrate dehydratase PrpD